MRLVLCALAYSVLQVMTQQKCACIASIASFAEAELHRQLYDASFGCYSNAAGTTQGTATDLTGSLSEGS